MPGKKFPDLTGDGKVTRADIMKGRGVEGFKDGGPVYRDQPMEPVTGEEETSAFMDEMLFQDRRLKDEKSREEYKKTSRRGDQEPVEKYAMGGSVCAGARSAIRGKKFKGTF